MGGDRGEGGREAERGDEIKSLCEFDPPRGGTERVGKELILCDKLGCFRIRSDNLYQTAVSCV